MRRSSPGFLQTNADHIAWIYCLSYTTANSVSGNPVRSKLRLADLPFCKSCSLFHKVGETAEIRCRLVRGGYYQPTTYQIRYFQPDGKGKLEMDNGTVFLPNDLYPLEKETFRLYYTSASTDQQTIDIYIIDSFGQMQQLTLSFNNDNSEEGTETITP